MEDGIEEVDHSCVWRQIRSGFEWLIPVFLSKGWNGYLESRDTFVVYWYPR